MPHPYARFRRVVTAAEMRLLDRTAIDELHIPSLTLMENAAKGIAQAVLDDRHAGLGAGTVVAVCGPGNNGGDGLAAARLLKAAGARVRALLLADKFAGDAAVNLEAFRQAGGDIARFPGRLSCERGDVILDAVFGTGLSRAPEGEFERAIQAMNDARALGVRIVAVDIPSGLSADTGAPLGAVVSADRTVTFAYLKCGHVFQPGKDLSGPVQVVDIGIPASAEAKLQGQFLAAGDAETVRSLIPRRDPASHKGTFGHLLVIAGSTDKAGAAALVCRAALRAGVGLCTLAARPPVVDRVVALVPEAMGRGIAGSGPLGPADLEPVLAAAKDKSAIAIGPGLELGAETGSVIAELLARATVPVAVDADGLNALSSPALLAKACGGPATKVFTPHPGEMSKLVGKPIADIQAARLDAARALARERGVVVVLKGASTVVATPGGEAYVNPTGNAGMATAGTGDVLTGLLGGLLAQRIAPEVAAVIATYVHGASGDRMALRRGLMGLMATDLVEGLPEVWAEWGV